jgi:hypothetical protein
VEVAGIEPAEPPVFTGLRRYSPAFSALLTHPWVSWSDVSEQHAVPV